MADDSKGGGFENFRFVCRDTSNKSGGTVSVAQLAS